MMNPLLIGLGLLGGGYIYRKRRKPKKTPGTVGTVHPFQGYPKNQLINTAYPEQDYPGLNYPWLYPAAPAPSNPTVTTSRICLGSKCWPLARLTTLDADQIVRTLCEKSFPATAAHNAAQAFYEHGWYRHALAVADLYGDNDWAKKIKNVTEPC